MGIFKNLLRYTPFNNSFKNYLKQKENRKRRKLEEELQPQRVAFYSTFIKPGDRVFDIGANVGNRVSSFLACSAKVIAVEPQPSCVNVLKEKFGNSIVIESVGISTNAGELEMQIASDSTVSSFNQEFINNTRQRFKHTKWLNKIRVPVITLDDLIKKHGVPEFCKIDVEGYELEVLKGLHQPLPMLSLEYCVPEMHQQIVDCISYLHSLSPTGKFNFSIGESMLWALPSWFSAEEFLHFARSQEFVKTSFGDIYFRSSEVAEHV